MIAFAKGGAERAINCRLLFSPSSVPWRRRNVRRIGALFRGLRSGRYALRPSRKAVFKDFKMRNDVVNGWIPSIIVPTPSLPSPAYIVLETICRLRRRSGGQHYRRISPEHI